MFSASSDSKSMRSLLQVQELRIPLCNVTVQIMGCFNLGCGLPELQFCEQLCDSVRTQYKYLLDIHAECNSIHLLITCGSIWMQYSLNDVIGQANIHVQLELKLQYSRISYLQWELFLLCVANTIHTCVVDKQGDIKMRKKGRRWIKDRGCH